MQQGKIVEYIDQGRFICTYCLQDKGNKLHLLTTSNREVNFSPKRSIIISDAALNIDRNTEELIENHKLVFFPFHEPITADEIKCLDGSTYIDDEDDPKIDIGVADNYGYLVEVREGSITFYPALYDGSSGPLPSLTVQHECGVFDDQMESFLERFVEVRR